MSGNKGHKKTSSKSNASHQVQDEKSKPGKDQKRGKDKDGDAEMTVVVPSSKPDEHENGVDVVMNGTGEATSEAEVMIDPKIKAANGEPVLYPWVSFQTNAFPDIKANLALLEKAVTLFDPRYTLRVLRTIPSIRQHFSAEILARAIIDTYTLPTRTSVALLKALGNEKGFPKKEADEWYKKKDAPKSAAQKGQPVSSDILPEVDVYYSILLQVYFYDTGNNDIGSQFSEALVGHLKTLNRRTLDSLAARAYFYYSMFFEEKEPLPPSPHAAVVGIRKTLLDALRTATLRKDQELQASATTLLLRNYLSTGHITQANLLIPHTKLPDSAANNQVARYLYYLGRISAIQLNYSEAREHLIGATRKAPTSYKASGFYQAATKLSIVVELLMGDIPDRAVFRQPSLEKSLAPYLQLVQAVSAGDVPAFQNLVVKYASTFRADNTYTLILRLRQNVIKTGIRMMSLSYARISLRDMCLRLGLDSEESAEYIVAKAIRDGVIEATLDHEHGFMKSKDVGDVYGSTEPFDAYSRRIRACLSLHDESVKVGSTRMTVLETFQLTNPGHAFSDEPTQARVEECPRSSRA